MPDDEQKTKIQRLEDLVKEEAKGARTPYLIVLSGNAIGRMYKISQGEMVIGRVDTCDIMLDDEGVSRKHSRIIGQPDGTVAILDLGSTNGTWVEGQKITYRQLKDGDRIQIGPTNILKYGYQDAVEERFVSQLYESATQDGLTGVYNKRFFVDRLKMEFSWHERHRQPLTLIIFDIDHFKKCNDTYGHHTGDFILKTLAKHCAEVTRAEDVFARYGGEEFVCLLRQTTADEGVAMAERMRTTVELIDFQYPGEDGVVHVRVTISLGVAQTNDGMHAPEDLIELADKYLYKAKEGGRNQTRCASEDMADEEQTAQ